MRLGLCHHKVTNFYHDIIEFKLGCEKRAKNVSSFLIHRPLRLQVIKLASI